MRNIVRNTKSFGEALNDVGFCCRVQDALHRNPPRYKLRDGTIVLGRSITELKRELAALRKGLDADAFTALGFKVQEAMYVGGVSPSGKWVKIIVTPQRSPTIEERGLAAFEAIKDDPALGPLSRELKSLTDRISKR